MSENSFIKKSYSLSILNLGISLLIYFIMRMIINIFGIEFYVVDLHDTEGIRMLDGCLFNTDLEIDFDR